MIAKLGDSLQDLSRHRAGDNISSYGEVWSVCGGDLYTGIYTYANGVEMGEPVIERCRDTLWHDYLDT